MFDKADLLSLPCQGPFCASIASHRTRQQSGLGGASAVVPVEVGVVEGYDADAGGQHLSTHQMSYVAVEDQPGACSEVTWTHVVEACAMDDENVALALSDGRLCYADLSRSTEPLAAPLAEQENNRWPDWKCWRSRHGNIQQLAFSPAHGAIMTLEKATTAAGDQLFLGTYHRPQSAGFVGASGRGRGEDSRWSGCSIPLGASRARMAVCPCRGWVAVCTGSMVNLWAVGRSGGARRTSNSGWNGENGRDHRQARQTQTAGFEHALAVDLAELVGFVGGEGGKDGGTKHVALFGNTLAVATDHAIFLLALTFDVRGESHKARKAAAVSSPSAPAVTESLSKPPPAATDPQPAATSRQSPKANNPRGRSESSRTSRSSTQLKDFPPKGTSRAAASGKAKSDSRGSRIGGSGSGGGRAGSTLASTRRRKEAGGISDPEREMSKKIGGSASGGGGGGLVEGAITDAEDMVVCVVHPEEDSAVEAADGSAAEQLPPLLRSFDDDWQAFNEREEASSDPWDPPQVVPLVATGSSPPLALPVTANPAVVDGSGRCEVMLARRVAVGETVKELHLLPASPSPSAINTNINRDGALSHSDAEHSSDRPFRMVLITTRGATVCLVCAARSPTSHYAAPTSTSTATAVQPLSPLLPLERPHSGSWCSVVSASPPSSPSELPPTPTSASLSGKAARSPLKAGDRRGRPGVSYGKGDVTGQEEELEELEEIHQAVFLRRCFRFNHDVVRAAVHGCFLFVLTVEGIQVWTFPPDRPSMILGREASGVEGIGKTMPGTPRPCLLHMQRLEVDGVLPRSPPRCLLVVGGVRQTVLLFPPAQDQSVDLAFVTRQQRPRRRSFLRLYPQDEYGEESNRRRENTSAGTRPQEPQPPATAPLTLDARLLGEKTKEDAGDQDGNQHNSQAETMKAKLKAWQKGFCAGRSGRTGGPYGGSGDAFPVGLALALRVGTPTEAFRRLADGEVRARRPLSVSALSAFVSAAEGLHTCLLEEAAESWRVAFSQKSFGGDGGGDRDPTGRARMFTDAVALGGVCPEVGKEMRIETVLGGLTRCWRLNREGSRCAALVGRLMLEEAEGAAAAVGSQNAINNPCTAASVVAGQAYARACAWMLASRESVANSFERLQKAAESVTTALKAAGNTPEVQQAERVAPATVSNSTDDRSTASLEGCFALENIQAGLFRALYDDYLLPALGMASVAGSSVSSIHVSLPPLTERRQRRLEDRHQEASLEGVIENMVEYLHARDMQWYTQPTELRQIGRGEARCSTSLAAAVVCAGRVPWAACPLGLRHALAALEEQERALEETVGAIRNSRSRSKTGGSGSDSINLLSSGFLTLEGVACGSDPVGGAFLTRSGNHAPAEEGRRPAAPAIQWIATARMVLTAYSEEMNLEEMGGRARGSNNQVGLTVVDRIVELACERHPSLVISPKSGAGGSLAKALLGMGRTRPLVSALVRLTSRNAGGDCGTGEAPTGPHMAQELLQLKEHCFAPPVDPLQALLVFGIPGRQIAARLDSLRRSSLDASLNTVIPPGSFESQNSDTFPQSGGGGVDRSPDGDTQYSLLQAASRDFLSRRCAASLARGGDLVAWEEERLSNAWGAPEAWQAAVASNRALDRAILRYLIGAHLDDLRALEHPAISGVSGRGAEMAPMSDDSSGNGRYEQPGTAVYGGRGSWAEAIFPLLTAQVSKGRGGAAEAHLDAITSLVREVTWQGVYPEGIGRGAGGNWRGIRPSEASEVVIEAKRRLPVSATARGLTTLSTVETMMGREDADVDAGDDDDRRSIVPWGCGGAGTEISRSPWPWGPRAVPPSAVGALVALAAALPAAGNLLGGLEVMLQVADEVVKAAKAEAAKAAGVAAAAKAGRGNGRQVERSPADASTTITGSGVASAELLVAERIQEVSVIAKRALLLYSVEYCGRNPELWASVTEHIRHTVDGRKGRAGSGSTSTGAERLVEALLRQCGEEIGGRALVRALPDEMDIVECLDVVEQNLVLE